jgi:hypothetical protein
MDLEYEKKKLYLDLIREGIRNKFEILLYISSLTAALLVVASFGGTLFSVGVVVRLIISGLLVLMVLSVQVYMTENTDFTREAYTALYKSVGKERDNPYTGLNPFQSLKFLLTGDVGGKKSDKSFYKRFSSQLTAYAVTFLWVIVFVLLVLIWSNAGQINERHDARPSASRAGYYWR